MPLIYDYFFPAMWLAFMAYWWVMSKNIKVSERRESLLSRLVRLVLILCAVARGEWRGLLAVVLVFGVLWRKLKLEEKWMRVQFGESYDVYSRRVAALLPYVV